MPSPPVQVFLTTIASQASLRQRQEYLLRILQVRKIQFTSYDLASDEAAKKLWRRKAPLDKQQLPGILVGGRFPGTFAEFEEAVEYDELSTFLRLNETWDEDIDGERPAPPVQPVGVPGASSPSQMTNHKPSFAASPSPLRSKKKNEGEEFDVGTELVGFGLQGVKVTHDELSELVAELGLGGPEAEDLVKNLSGADSSKEANKVDKQERSELAAGPPPAEAASKNDIDNISEAEHAKTGVKDPQADKTDGQERLESAADPPPAEAVSKHNIDNISEEEHAKTGIKDPQADKADEQERLESAADPPPAEAVSKHNIDGIPDEEHFKPDTKDLQVDKKEGSESAPDPPAKTVPKHDIDNLSEEERAKSDPQVDSKNDIDNTSGEEHAKPDIKDPQVDKETLPSPANT